jgi:DNA mismatch repair protein MLH1
VYLSLQIPAEHIDVNVHPTKKQVIFERQDEFCEYLKSMLEDKLKNSASDRSFTVDTFKVPASQDQRRSHHI